MFARKSPITSNAPMMNPKGTVNINELVENIRNSMNDYFYSAGIAKRKSLPETYGMKTAKNAIQKKIEKLREVDPKHSLVVQYNALQRNLSML